MYMHIYTPCTEWTLLFLSRGCRHTCLMCSHPQRPLCFPTIYGHSHAHTPWIPHSGPLSSQCADSEPRGSSLVVESCKPAWSVGSVSQQADSAVERPLMGEDVVMFVAAQFRHCLHLGTAPEGNRAEWLSAVCSCQSWCHPVRLSAQHR